MGHNHHHEHHHHAGENIKVAFFLNFIFCIIEFIGGIFTNSVAILSDALHDLGDSVSLLLAWYFQKVSGKKRDAQYSYGYKRFSLLGALINSAVLLVGSVFIIIESVKRFAEPTQPKADGMIILAIIGLIANGLAVLRLKRGSSINERVVSLHLLEDVLGWVAVLIGSILMKFFDIPILDPLMSMGIATFILFNIYKNIKSTFKVILQGIPEDVDEEKITQSILDEAHVISMHDLHIWSMDGEYSVLTAHLVVDKSIASIEECDSIKKSLKEKLLLLGINHPTFEIEHEVSNCDGGC